MITALEKSGDAGPTVDEEVLKLWVRIMAIAVASTSPAPPAPAGADPAAEAAIAASVDEWLAEWRRAIDGAKELASSAPSAEWISDVFESAMTVWMTAEPILSAEAQKVITDAVKGSPAARNDDGTPRDVAGPEALVTIAGMMNRNGYENKSMTHPNRSLLTREH